MPNFEKMLYAMVDLMLSTGNINLPDEKQGLDANDMRFLKRIVENRQASQNDREMNEITRYQGM